MRRARGASPRRRGPLVEALAALARCLAPLCPPLGPIGGFGAVALLPVAIDEHRGDRQLVDHSLALFFAVDPVEVFRIVGAVGFLAYAAALAPPSIWMGKPWKITWKEMFDGLLYGLVTAGTFGWLWPR